MKKVLLFVFTILLFSGSLLSQNLIQADFTAEILPTYMAAGGSSRIPVVFRATVSNLQPNTLYRYYTQGARWTDLNTLNTGAGNPLFLNLDSAVYGYTSSTSTTAANGYRYFRTNESGQYTAWFGFLNTGNARFTAGNYIMPSITIGDSVGLNVIKRCMNDSILVLGFAATANATSGTGIWGKSKAEARNIVMLYDNTLGNTKPLVITYVENDSNSTITSTPQFYTDSVNSKNGNWGTIIPNLNANGVRRIELRSLFDGQVIASNVSETGIWLSGANTVNPTGGLTPVVINNEDAELPVELTSFNANVKGTNVNLIWKTSSELNNKGFAVIRKIDNGNFEQVGFVKGHGTTTIMNSYSFNDKAAVNGKYSYRLKQVDFDGTFELSNIVEVTISAPVKFSLNQNYPNPFNPTTNIKFMVDAKNWTSLKVYNVLGKEVATLFNGIADAGVEYSLNFNGSNLTSGVYFYRLESGSFSETKRMMLVK